MVSAHVSSVVADLQRAIQVLDRDKGGSSSAEPSHSSLEPRPSTPPWLIRVRTVPVNYPSRSAPAPALPRFVKVAAPPGLFVAGMYERREELVWISEDGGGVLLMDAEGYWVIQSMVTMDKSATLRSRAPSYGLPPYLAQWDTRSSGEWQPAPREVKVRAVRSLEQEICDASDDEISSETDVPPKRTDSWPTNPRSSKHFPVPVSELPATPLTEVCSREHRERFPPASSSAASHCTAPAPLHPRPATPRVPELPPSPTARYSVSPATVLSAP
eukprot:Hpha_TRINITY_DN18591_c0_g1::TRINITY_DN18591_c0_g1_i1::g.195205::m.195205